MKNKIKNLLKNLKIKKNDNILIHSNVAGIYQFSKNKKNYNRNLEEFFKIILSHIGKKGTILIPTYNYNFTKGKHFDKKKSLSQVGELGNFLIKKYPNSRTNDPIFSHVVFGKLKKNIFNCSINEAFGDKSIFNLILKKKFKIICFCTSPATMTFIHFLEKKLNVNYRFNKYFKSSIILNNKKVTILYKYCVGKKKFKYNLKENKILNLLGKKLISKNFGRFICTQIDTKELYNKIKKKLSENKYFLIK